MSEYDGPGFEAGQRARARRLGWTLVLVILLLVALPFAYRLMP